MEDYIDRNGVCLVRKVYRILRWLCCFFYIDLDNVRGIYANHEDNVMSVPLLFDYNDTDFLLNQLLINYLV